MGNYYFTAKNLCVGYDGKPIIRDMEISLSKGEILTLIGPNGAGKSTVLKSIAGQLRLIGGVVCLEGDVLSEMKQNERAKKMSVVLTEKIKTELMNCMEVVATGRYPYTGRFGMLSQQDRQMVQEAMELVHVWEIKEHDFQKCSDGQKQRVMLARAICQQPEIIILDEPVSYLDICHKLEFLSVLQELKKKKGLTVIMSLHELDLAERVSDKILCLKGELVEAFGTPGEVFRSGYIRQLYGIAVGSFDERNGNPELEKPDGVPEVFVIAGGGSGRAVYRRLQREKRAFLTGILYENDLDYPVAEALATEVITAKAFEPMPECLYMQARQRMDSCDDVICTKNTFGSLEQFNEKLLRYAEETGKRIEYVECCDIWQR